MHFSFFTSTLYLVILGIHVFMQLAAAILIYVKQHQPKNHAWLYIFIFFSASALASIGEFILTLASPSILDSYKVLDPILIFPGFYIFSLLFCYIIENMRPHWLTLRRWLLVFSPCIAMTIALVAMATRFDFIDYYHLRQFIREATLPDVIIRIGFASLYLPYCLGLIVLRFRWKNRHLQHYIDILITITVIMCISYIASRGLQIFAGYVVHEVLYLLLTIAVLYAEHYERLHIPMEQVRQYYSEDDKPTTTQVTLNHVITSLQKLMEQSDIWTDPELTGDKIVQMIGTNRTYIQLAAKQLGFANLSDMLRRRRIDYVCQRLRETPDVNIQDLFYEAGYKSRTTAWRHFLQIVGETPSEFIEKLKHKVTPNKFNILEEDHKK